MNDHIPDVTKMISDTPRMKAARNAAMEHSTGDVWRVGCDIECELNAANAEIEEKRKVHPRGITHGLASLDLRQLTVSNRS